ncbi:MAG: porin [Ectothiorhodospiraceae bacterium]|nr:porin [Ectothiorhodospiraceae bacterium]MCH8504193.1 porin [Ectothiorhodospiraceae bacterium]
MPLPMPVRLPLALCCVLLPAVAHAVEVNLYGRVHAGYANLDTSRAGNAGIINDERGHSRLGVDLAAPLGDNVGGLARIELGFDPTNWDGDDDPVSVREAWVGLQGATGRLTVGRLPGVYKTTGGTRWDPMSSTLLQQRRTGGMSGGIYGHSNYLDRALEYRTPSLGGLQLRLQYGVDDRENDGDYLIGLSYQEGPWELIAAWSRNNDEEVASGERRNWKAGIRYAADEGALVYQYEDAKVRDRLDTTDLRRVDGSLEIGNFDMPFNTRHHMLGLQQNLQSSFIWLAVGYLNASADDFDVISYTASWTLLFSQNIRWYLGYQHQDRERGYESGRLNVVATGFQLDF